MHDDHPHISAVIPLYNKERHIARAIESVLHQTVPVSELIVVDDGSTDGSLNVVKQFSDPRLKIIAQTNRGPGAARNRGLRECSGQWVSFLDADDEWMDDFLEFSLDNLRANPDCVLSASGQFRHPEKVEWQTAFEKTGIYSGKWFMPTDMAAATIKVNFDFLHSGAIVCRRSIIEEFGGFYDKNVCKWNEDLYLWLQIALNYKFYRSTAPKMWYHTEDSECFIWPIGKTQIPPLLTDTDPIRQSCPQQYRAFLEEVLAHYALYNAELQINCHNVGVAHQFLIDFPIGTANSLDFWKLEMRILVQSLRLIRGRLRNQARLTSGRAYQNLSSTIGAEKKTL